MGYWQLRKLDKESWVGPDMREVLKLKFGVAGNGGGNLEFEILV